MLAGAGRSEPTPPPAALLRRDSQQWLLTDGADPMLLAWPDARRPDRVVQVAGVTRNVGLERLSARRHGDDSGTFDLLLQVTNGGTVDEDRVVVFTVGAAEVARADIGRLPPGASRRVEVSIPAAAEVRAALQPADALPDDDQIALDLAPLRRRRVAVDASCPKALAAAVSAHPALAARSARCGRRRSATRLRRAVAHRWACRRFVQFPIVRRPARAASLRWSSAVPQSRRGEFDTDRLQLAAELQARASDVVLLAIGDEPAVVRRAGEPPRLDTSFDFTAMAATRGPELPLLVNWLFETALDRSLLDEIAVVDRGRRSVLVAPLPIAVAAPAVSAAAVARSPSDEATLVLLIALLALLWEAAALVRQGIRLRAPATARTG